VQVLRKILNPLNLLVSLSVIGSLIWFHGYQYQPHHLHPHLIYLHVCFGFYLIQFVLRAWMSGAFNKYLSENKLEYFLFFALVVEMAIGQILGFSVAGRLLSFTGIENHDHVFILFLHIWLLLIVGIELGKATTRSTIWKLSPPILFILSFVVLIIVGSSLLMLPEMTIDQQGISFVDALFTSISANCVTGLTVVDTATYFSIKGKVLILLLVQLGGLNVIAFATYFISFFRTTLTGQGNVATIRELLHTNNLGSTQNMVKKVVITTLVTEFIGTMILYQQWSPSLAFTTKGEKLFYSAFHAISAFNNAGFTLFTDGFTNARLQGAFPMHITIAILIVLGGIGFTTIQDIFHPENLARSFKKGNFKIPVQSAIALISSALLIIVGAALFFVLENSNSMVQQSNLAGIVTSFFQSITARTAGFNTVDIGGVTTATLALMMVLMFIGASSGSTGGGIKTSTFAVLILAQWKRRERENNYGNSFLTVNLVRKATSILLYSLVVIIVGTVILMLVEPEKTFSGLLFEEISAIGTVGLSTGITSDLSPIGKVVIMVSMFIGRVGPLALAYALIKSATANVGNQEKGIMIG